jgi:predicted ferric reductase
VEAVVAKFDNIQLHLIDSSVRGRLTTAEVIDSIQDMKQTRVYFCGPKLQRQILRQNLNKAGLKHTKFHYEEFEIRAGIGIRKLLKIIITTYQRLRK